ncbi:MAG: hypothetical protein WBD65_00165, partial [Methylocella sp.]
TLPLMIFWSLVIAGGLIKRRGRALRNPGQLRARPRLMLRPYDTKCPIKCKLLHVMTRIKQAEDMTAPTIKRNAAT